MLRTATEGGTSGAAKTSYSGQSFGVRSAHAGRDMPGAGTRSARSFSAVDLRPDRPATSGRHTGTEPRDGHRNGRRTPAHNSRGGHSPSPPPGRRHPRREAGPVTVRRRGRGGRRGAAPGRRAARGRWHTAREAAQRLPGRSATRGDCGSGTRRPAAHRQAAWRRRGPIHGSPCNRPQPSRHRAHRRAHGHMVREHDRTPRAGTPRTPSPNPRETAARPPRRSRGRAAGVPRRGRGRALSAPRRRCCKGLDSRHPARDT